MINIGLISILCTILEPDILVNAFVALLIIPANYICMKQSMGLFV